MLAALLVVFREVIEAGLIVGIVLAATKGCHAGAYGLAMGWPEALPAPVSSPPSPTR